MTELVVRRLLIDLETPFARHWCGGDAFRSALFNALSMSFPVGEQFFIDAVRDGHKALPPDRQAQFADEVRGFIGQEATHRRIHALFNGHLDQQGLANEWAPRAQERMKLFAGADPRHPLAVTAANEHFTVRSGFLSTTVMNISGAKNGRPVNCRLAPSVMVSPSCTPPCVVKPMMSPA